MRPNFFSPFIGLFTNSLWECWFWLLLQPNLWLSMWRPSVGASCKAVFASSEWASFKIEPLCGRVISTLAPEVGSRDSSPPPRRLHACSHLGLLQEIWTGPCLHGFHLHTRPLDSSEEQSRVFLQKVWDITLSTLWGLSSKGEKKEKKKSLCVFLWSLNSWCCLRF